MTHPFGGPVRLIAEGQGGDKSLTAPSQDMELVRRTLSELQLGGLGILRLYRPQPTAAFSPRDTTHPDYPLAAKGLREKGFHQVERGAGGQLAVYDQSVLVIDLIAPHPQPREHIHERFRLFAGVIGSALSTAGIDARVGQVAGEYCPGAFSVNAGGRIKLAGLAQRVRRNGYHLGAVISVARSDAARAAVAEAYRVLEIPFDPATFGAMTELIPVLSYDAARNIVSNAVTSQLDIQ